MIWTANLLIFENDGAVAAESGKDFTFFLQFFSKKFGVLKKVRTFAARFGREGA